MVFSGISLVFVSLIIMKVGGEVEKFEKVTNIASASDAMQRSLIYETVNTAERLQVESGLECFEDETIKQFTAQHKVQGSRTILDILEKASEEFVESTTEVEFTASFEGSTAAFKTDSSTQVSFQTSEKSTDSTLSESTTQVTQSESSLSEISSGNSATDLSEASTGLSAVSFSENSEQPSRPTETSSDSTQDFSVLTANYSTQDSTTQSTSNDPTQSSFSDSSQSPLTDTSPPNDPSSAPQEPSPSPLFDPSQPTTETTSQSVSDSSESPTMTYQLIDSTAPSTPACSTEENEIVNMTKENHELRMKLAKYSHTIKTQQSLITKLSDTVSDLQSDVEKLRATSDKELNDLRNKSDDCRLDFNNLMTDMKVAKKLIAMGKYSKALREKLKEFQVVEDAKVNPSKAILKFSVFEIETDEYSGKILSNRQLHILPPEIGQIIANVSELSASNVGLVAVNSNAFVGLNHLNILNLAQNEISEIESESFVSLIGLRQLDLSLNAIARLDVNAFVGLIELEWLSLRGNKISRLDQGTFDSLLNLKVLILSFNEIRELESEIFTEINVIEEFYCDNNRIELINPNIISGFDSAKIIDFGGNLCIDQTFPDNLTIVQLALEVAEYCWKRF